MANVLCVLYEDPVDGYPPQYPRDEIPKIERYPDGQTTPTPEAIDFTPGELLGSVSGELGLRKFLEDAGHQLVVTSDKDGPESALRAGAARSGRRDLAALLAGLPDRRADRQGAEAEARDHRRHRIGPRRPSGGDRARDHRRRGHLLQLDQRLRARRDDDPGAGPQLHPVLRVGGRRRLEHRRLRRALLRPRRNAGRHGRGRADRLGRAAAAEAVRRQPPLHRPAPAAGEVEGELGLTFHPTAEALVRGLRRGDDQRAAASGDREPVRRWAARAR